jgi:hypothetical protein
MNRELIKIPIVLLALIALSTGIISGLDRLGISIPVIQDHYSKFHGPLMICGFLGTIIGLERAIALKNKIWYLAPFLSGIGGLLLLFAAIHILLSKLIIAAGSLLFVLIFFEIISKQKSLATITMLLGALCWLSGNILWIVGVEISHLIGLWAGFLILTIAGERIELSRYLSLSKRSKYLFLTIVSVVLFGLLVWIYHIIIGQQIFGIGLLLLAFWLVKKDIALRTIKKEGLSRFIALALISGFFWLAISGVLSIIFAGNTSGPYHDAILHSLFLGFVFSMIFGHAPIILPSISGVTIPFYKIIYSHLLLLHLSLIFRIIADIQTWALLRQWAGILNGVAILLFFINTAGSVGYYKIIQKYGHINRGKGIEK